MKGVLGSKRRFARCAALLGALAAFTSGTASAFFDFNTGKVWLTNGASITDGAAGGGINPWAVIAGMETRDGINASFHYTYANLPNYSLNSVGVNVGFYDRLELSYAWDELPTGSTFNTVGLVTQTLGGLLTDPTVGPLLRGVLNGGSNPSGANIAATGIEPFNTQITMNVFGAKLRVFGEAIYDSDNLIPQVSIGGFYKVNSNKDLLKTLGANKSKDFEAYIAATKIFFPLNLAVSATARYSSANQTGLTGFGNEEGNKRKVKGEFSVAYLLNDRTALGAEYAMHSNNLSTVHLGGLTTGSLLSGLQSLNLPVLSPTIASLNGTLAQHESDWKDIFFAYAPSKNLYLVFAYAMLGNITLTPHQNGYYMSAQINF